LLLATPLRPIPSISIASLWTPVWALCLAPFACHISGPGSKCLQLSHIPWHFLECPPLGHTLTIASVITLIRSQKSYREICCQTCVSLGSISQIHPPLHSPPVPQFDLLVTGTGELPSAGGCTINANLVTGTDHSTVSVTLMGHHSISLCHSLIAHWLVHCESSAPQQEGSEEAGSEGSCEEEEAPPSP
jgi:hypothetical protein